MYSPKTNVEVLEDAYQAPTHCQRVNARLPAHDDRPALAPPFLASMALTEFSNAFFKTPAPMVPSTTPSSRPLRFLPSRTTTTSMSVKPSGRRVKVYVWPDAPPHVLESVVVRTTWLG